MLLVAATVSAQQASGIAGVVRDTSSGVLPGVTVEAASPALIEKVRTAVTDGQGNYKILELRPGRYTVTFSLSGFATYRRGDIDLPTGVNADRSAARVKLLAEMQDDFLEKRSAIDIGQAFSSGVMFDPSVRAYPIDAGEGPGGPQRAVAVQ